MKIALDVRILAEKRVGKASQLLYLLQGFSQVGAEHQFILYSKDDPQHIPESENMKVKTKKIPMPFWHLWCWFDFVFIEKVDLFFATLSYIVPSFSKKCVVLVHDLISFLDIVTHNKKAQYIEKITLKSALKNARGIIAVSENTKKDIVNIFGINERAIEVVAEAIDPQFYLSEKEDVVKAVMHKHGLDPGYIFFISTLEPRKNIIRIIQAYDLAKKKNPEIPKLVMAGGKGWGYALFDEKLQSLGAKDAIELLGHVDPGDLRALYQSAGMYLFPALYEGFGLTVLEAMASRVPVITSRSGSLPEVGGDAVLYTNQESIEDISNKIVLLAENASLREELRKKGYEQAGQFDIKKMAIETIRYFEKINENQK